MKRLFALILAVLMLSSFAACSAQKPQPTAGSNDPGKNNLLWDLLHIVPQRYSHVMRVKC